MTNALITSRHVLAREIKSALARAEMPQSKLADALSISSGSLSDKMKGRVAFSFDDLLTIAGTLGLSLDELLGEALTNQRVPSPSYFEDEKGKKKVAPIGFIPNGTTYQMVANAEPVLAGVGPAGLEPATKGL
ncbi:XRE family transcriptional regulator [Rothia nasimurium]|uniref:XRE family transcriptional regulator n=1 Tax=Rothia nasimurium TaxID=85336 RepID=A0A4Y9F8Q8_9MICC|nr:helix-turn-helix transcriptional regulator [Rothia nasimurium]TFU24446.1 XRE family transcriptional regulator [Rothia nasimurium]